MRMIDTRKIILVVCAALLSQANAADLQQDAVAVPAAQTAAPATSPAAAEESVVGVQEDPHAPVFNRIAELMSLGVPELALSFVQHAQPEPAEDNIAYWLHLEQKRFQLLVQLEHWQSIIDRAEFHQPVYKKFLISYADRNWFRTQQIRAFLQLKQYPEALSHIRRYMWSEKEQADADVIALWRRLIIRSYLNMGAVDDAQRAMRRYRQDYGYQLETDGHEWPLLQAQLLMRTGAPQEALQILQQIDHPEAIALSLLAKLQARLLSADEVENEIQQRLSDPELDARQQSVYWYVRLQMAVQGQDNAAEVRALEELFYLQATSYLYSVYTDAERYISVDRLWDAYQRYGLQLANNFKLLRGDDAAWYSKASNLFESEPQQAKALLAVLVFNATQQEHRSVAMMQMTGLLEKRDNGLDLVNRLFLNSEHVTSVDVVPAEVRYRLVDYALSNADVQAAARLMETLQKPPEGQDQFQWSLRRARILILSNKYQDGIDILLKAMDDTQELATEQIDQYMQVVFDLQNVQQHRLALVAFDKLEQKPLSVKLHREITFWKAESYQQLKDYQLAAFLFLKSAIPPDGKIDPWFHTASFRAAESLAQAGLVEDARRQYLRLLRMTVNSARKAVIRQRLQQLRLKQSGEAANGAAG